MLFFGVKVCQLYLTETEENTAAGIYTGPLDTSVFSDISCIKNVFMALHY